MRVRHITALALLGWYVMIPPKGSNGEQDPSAPLGRWHDFRAFDTARECRDFLDGMVQPKRDTARDDDRRTVQQGLSHGRCISSDDPRLAQ